MPRPMREPSLVMEGLRDWARGAYAEEAAVELLIWAFGGEFASIAYPWVVSEDDEPGWWLDGERLIHATGHLSGGEQRVLAVVGALVSGEALPNLGGLLAALDRPNLALVLAAMAHAGGSHEQVDVHVDGDRLLYSRLGPLVGWPASAVEAAAFVSTVGVAVLIGLVVALLVRWKIVRLVPGPGVRAVRPGVGGDPGRGSGEPGADPAGRLAGRPGRGAVIMGAHRMGTDTPVGWRAGTVRVRVGWLIVGWLARRLWRLAVLAVSSSAASGTLLAGVGLLVWVHRSGPDAGRRGRGPGRGGAGGVAGAVAGRVHPPRHPPGPFRYSGGGLPDGVAGGDDHRRPVGDPPTGPSCCPGCSGWPAPGRRIGCGCECCPVRRWTTTPR